MKKEKTTKALPQQFAPPSIIFGEEKFSTPLARRLYYEQCETHQVIDWCTIEKLPFVRHHFPHVINYGLEYFLNIDEAVYEDVVRFFSVQT